MKKQQYLKNLIKKLNELKDQLINKVKNKLNI